MPRKGMMKDETMMAGCHKSWLRLNTDVYGTNLRAREGWGGVGGGGGGGGVELKNRAMH